MQIVGLRKRRTTPKNIYVYIDFLARPNQKNNKKKDTPYNFFGPHYKNFGPQKKIVATILIDQEIQCLLYAVFLWDSLMGHFDETFLWDILMRHFYGTF